ncbi:MAG: LacI family DNA-binding transcriptional regulator [Actinomycetes bacterium]
MVGVKDVAARAGVAVGTVSNVLNRPDRVADSTRERVLSAIEELGFVRNEAARQLRAGLSNCVGLVVLNAANPFFNDVAAGAEECAARHGLSVLVGNSAEREDREDAYLDLFEQQRVRGVLVSPIGAVQPKLDRLRSHGIATVVVDRDESAGSCSSVSVDDVAGGALALGHLAELGHRHVAYVGGPDTLRQVIDRHAGAEREAARHGVRLEWFRTPGMTIAAGVAAGDELFARPQGERPTALFGANDLIALGLLQSAAHHRLRVPDDVALVGYDDIQFAEGAAIPLTSVAQPRHEIGRRAMEMLLSAADDPDRPTERVVLQPTLVVRRSTDRHAPMP